MITVGAGMDLWWNKEGGEDVLYKCKCIFGHVPGTQNSSVLRGTEKKLLKVLVCRRWELKIVLTDWGHDNSRRWCMGTTAARAAHDKEKYYNCNEDKKNEKRQGHGRDEDAIMRYFKGT